MKLRLFATIGILVCTAKVSLAVPVACPSFGPCEVSNSIATIGLDETSRFRSVLDDWEINGVDHLFNVQWAVRTGGITTIPADFSFLSVTADEDTDTLAALATTTNFNVLFEYQLAPDGLSIVERLTLTNTTTQSADYRLFGKTDYDIAGNDSNQLGFYNPNNNTFTQRDPAFPEFVASWSTNESLSGVEMPAPSGLFRSLTSLSGASLETGPTDVRFAYSIDTTLAAGESATFTFTKSMSVPEPSALLTLGSGGLILLGVMIRRRW